MISFRFETTRTQTHLTQAVRRQPHGYNDVERVSNYSRERTAVRNAQAQEHRVLQLR